MVSVTYVDSSSRMSQIYKNHMRKSCEGLSMAMFATAATANSFYGAAILMRASTWMLLINSVPWLLGRGLHSFTFQLNVSAFCGIGGACRGC